MPANLSNAIPPRNKIPDAAAGAHTREQDLLKAEIPPEGKPKSTEQHQLSESDKKLAIQIGKTCRAARHALHMTQENVADEIGVTSDFYGFLERGRALPSVKVLRSLGQVLGITYDEMLGLSEGRAGVSQMPVPIEKERPELRRIMRYLRQADRGKRQLIEQLLKAAEQSGLT